MTEQVKLKYDPRENQIQSYEALLSEEESKLNIDQGIKLGWIEGVLNPCLLSIWGVMLFLRLPWIVGQAGILESIIIILISLIIITITTFSLSAISTNGRIKGGGLYFIISRSIGPEFGASMGILLALANTISVALNTIGFCLSFKSLLQSFDIHILDTTFGFILTGLVAILIMGALCGVGMDDEAKVQNVLLVFIVGAIFDVIIGSFKKINSDDTALITSGYTGFSIETFKENWYSNYRPQDGVEQSFFTIFAIFFPSVTGIQAGANISGDLKDPSSAIPKGTLLSILITITSYIVLIIISGAVSLREASGISSEFDHGLYLNCSKDLTRKCTQGLYHNENLMQIISVWPYLIYLGCFAATLSTALTALISVPKILQRMGQDDIYPFLKSLAKGYGKSNEPYRAQVLAILLSSTFLFIGELNAIASFITTIYLCAYALLNVCTFHVAHYNPLGWRPSYKIYNKWLSLAGAIICVSVMIFIDQIMSIVVGCFVLVLYYAAAGNKDTFNWGSSDQTQQIKSVIKNIYKGNNIQLHVKNYTPNIMVFSGEPNLRKELVYLAHLITKRNGLLTCINTNKESLAYEQKQKLLDKGIDWLRQKKIKSLYKVIDGADLGTSVYVINSCGQGILKPNILQIGFKNNWFGSTTEDIQNYLNILNTANANGLATIIVRLSMINTTDTAIKNVDNEKPTVEGNPHVYEDEQLHNKVLINNEENIELKPIDCSIKIHNNQFSFAKKRKSGTVDVWWLYNDGGLALIITHIFQTCDTWKKCTFRIFGVTDQINNIDTEKNKLKQLLLMYRVQFDFIDVVMANATSPKTMAKFTILWNQQFVNQENQKREDEKNNTQNMIDNLFIKDLLDTYSMKSDLIIISTSNTKDKLNLIYMYWIEIITGGLPPCILIQGNHIQTVTASA